MSKRTETVTVSRSAVHARIRRRLAREGLFVRKNGNRGHGDSDFWIVDAPRGHRAIVKGGFDERTLETYAREIGVLKPSEGIGSE